MKHSSLTLFEPNSQVSEHFWNSQDTQDFFWNFHCVEFEVSGPVQVLCDSGP